MTVTPSVFPQFMKAQAGGAGFGTVIGEAVVTVEDDLAVSAELVVLADVEGNPLIAGDIAITTVVEGEIAVSVGPEPLVVVVEIGVC